MENLINLQEIQLKRGRLTPASKDEIARLRSDVPAPVLAHFDRMIARGKKGVAIAAKGVCTGCHLKISSGAWANLSDTSAIHLCDSCGRYLYLAPQVEIAEPPAAAPAPARARKPRKKAGLALA